MEPSSKQRRLDETDTCQSGDTSQTTLVNISKSSVENLSVQADVPVISQQTESGEEQNKATAMISNSSIDNMKVVIGPVTYYSPPADYEPQSKIAPSTKSINNFRQPPKEFVECTTFNDVKQKLRSRQPVLLLHGFPGSGKTAIVRKVAADFPFDKTQKVFVKYLIECSDNSEDIEGSLKKLLEQMWECKLTGSKARCKNASGELEKKRTTMFVELLAEADVPILIVIEDPPEKDCKLLIELANSINSKSDISNMQLCITSQQKSICNFSEQQCHKVCGLLEEEGLELLGVSDEHSESKKNAAKQIISDLGGSPLGLLAVRNTCKKFRKSYERYLKYPSSIHINESTHLNKGQGSHEKHTYQALVTLLDKKGMWDTAKILSFFHHGGIPQRLIGIIKQVQRNVTEQQLLQSGSDNEDESGEFISRLEDFSFCDVEGEGFQDTRITLHQVVFKAVRSTMNDEERYPALKQAVFALTSVVHKDLRKEAYEAFMRSMIPHLQSVLDFVKLHPDVLKDFVTSMAVTHLQEVYGCIDVVDDKGSAEKSLLSSARTVWDEVCKRSGKNMDFMLLVNQQNQPVAEVAEPIVEACMEAGENLRSNNDCLDEYIALVTRFKDDELGFLSNLSNDPEVTELLKVASEHCVGITLDTLHRIQSSNSGGIFLSTTKHYQVFFVGRLASIMYTLGRLALRDKSITPEKRSQFTWVSDMTHALCEQCSRQTGVKLLFLRLSAISRVNIRLKNSSATRDVDEKRKILEDAKEMAEGNLGDTTNETSEAFYENGLMKSMESNNFDELSKYRCIVRINTRLLSLPSNEDRNKGLGRDPDQDSKYLHELAKKHIDDWKLAAKCLVYCGKYWASLEKFEKAIECFQEALSCQTVVDDRAALFPRVCYNYARATVAGKLDRYKQDAIDKCEEALKNQDDISSDLVDKLNKELESLKRPFFYV